MNFKRSEFYAAMCIVIILCSLQTVFAVSYQVSVIQPTKPYQASILAAAVGNTTYTILLDITGRGIVTDIKMYGIADNNKLHIKVTVDGGSPLVIEGPKTPNVAISSAGAALYISTSLANSKLLCYSSLIYFKYSIKIEVMQDSGSARDIDATVNYATE